MRMAARWGTLVIAALIALSTYAFAVTFIVREIRTSEQHTIEETLAQSRSNTALINENAATRARQMSDIVARQKAILRRLDRIEQETKAKR